MPPSEILGSVVLLLGGALTALIVARALHDPSVTTWRQRYAWCRAQIALMELEDTEHKLRRKVGRISSDGARHYNARPTRSFTSRHVTRHTIG